MAKKVLGRGLGAFFPDYEDSDKPKDKNQTPLPDIKTAGPIHPADRVNLVLVIPIDHIRSNPNQSRTDFNEEALEQLVVFIERHGIIRPVTVRYLGPKLFELISGERRLRASRLAGKS